MPEALLDAVDASVLEEKCLTTADAAQWRRYLPASRSVFGSVEYASICERFRGSLPQLFVVQSGTSTICHPMLLRPVSDLPFAAEVEGKWDSTTPEFTGPLAQGSDSDLADRFRDLHLAFMRERGILAEFAHLHPWAEGRELLGEGCALNREIVWVDVSLSPETLFEEHFAHACRKNIKKAEREKVRIFTGSSDEAIREYYRIYSGTMRRNQALDRYSFSVEYFQAFRDLLPDHARFVFAEYDGVIIAATLYLHDDKDVYAYLGGADAHFNHLRPTNLLAWKTICWAHESGKKRLILGGGFRPNDGIYQFKATFSPLRQPFYVYKRIHSPDDYARLDQRCRDWNGMKEEHVDYFPSYRYVAD